MLKVIGIGSPHGSDQIGWKLVEQLKQRTSWNAEFVMLYNVSQIMEEIGNCSTAIFVDACFSGGVKGSIIEIQWPNLEHCWNNLHTSSHGMGLVDMLHLAENLDRLPPRVFIYGIEVEKEDDDYPPDQIESISEELKHLINNQLHSK